MTNWQDDYPLSRAYHGNRQRLGLEAPCPPPRWYQREYVWLRVIMIANVVAWIAFLKWLVS